MGWDLIIRLLSRKCRMSKVLQSCRMGSTRDMRWRRVGDSVYIFNLLLLQALATRVL